MRKISSVNNINDNIKNNLKNINVDCHDYKYLNGNADLLYQKLLENNNILKKIYQTTRKSKSSTSRPSSNYEIEGSNAKVFNSIVQNRTL